MKKSHPFSFTLRRCTMLSESVPIGTSDCFAMVRIPQSDQRYWMSTLESLYSAKKKRYDLNRGHNSRRGFISQVLIKAVKPQKPLCEGITKVATLKSTEVLGMVLA